MFTGIVEEIGRVAAVEHLGPDARLTIVGPLVVQDAGLGDSIAVDGVCLTVTELGPEPGSFRVDAMPETLARTTLGRLRAGAAVNLERALPASGRLDGHIVQGHVDGTATIVARHPGPRWDDLELAVPRGLLRYVAQKGSLTVSGVSLTVTGVDDESAVVGLSLIPTTLAATTLGTLARGDEVNLEVDVLAKYVERLLEARA